jgi:hypothetical protein
VGRRVVVLVVPLDLIDLVVVVLVLVLFVFFVTGAVLVAVLVAVLEVVLEVVLVVLLVVLVLVAVVVAVVAAGPVARFGGQPGGGGLGSLELPPRGGLQPRGGGSGVLRGGVVVVGGLGFAGAGRITAVPGGRRGCSGVGVRGEPPGLSVDGRGE